MPTAIVWFRKCLRLHDNPALTWACESSEVDSILPVFIMEEELGSEGTGGIGFNRARFLVQSLRDLDDSLQRELGLRLRIVRGGFLETMEAIIKGLDESYPYLAYEYCSEPKSLSVSAEISGWELSGGIDFESRIFSGSHTLLDIEKTVSSENYSNPKSMKDMERIFQRQFGVDDFGFYDIGEPLPPPVSSKPMSEIVTLDSEVGISDLDEYLINNYPRRVLEAPYFRGGEGEALERLSRKVSGEKDYVNNFKKPRTSSTNLDEDPREPSTTGLSPYLSTGCLSIRMLWSECKKSYLMGEHTQPPESLNGQMMFREMFYLLSRSVDNWDQSTGNENCKDIDWGEYDSELVGCWEDGMTGYPYIDAMMRQLEETGWMHHLGRHAVSCFLTRGQLWQSWTAGRDVFERKLLDSDWAVNNGNWLWLAGVAPFSMPYYRIYNPCPDSKSSLNVETNLAKFVRHWVPELKDYPSKYIFEPHLAPLDVQVSSGCIIGDDYPLPIVDRKESRAKNLERFKLSLQK